MPASLSPAKVAGGVSRAHHLALSVFPSSIIRRFGAVAPLMISLWLAVIAPGAQGQTTSTLIPSEFQVTFDSGGHSTPIIGQDSVGQYIVYTQYPVVNGAAGNSSIYYQRVAAGPPVGSPVVVADSLGNQWLDDASGDYIVYTLSPAFGQPGNIVLYQISTGQSRSLTTAGNAWAPRIHGDVVVWIEITPTGAGEAVTYLISSGVPVQTTVVAGPSPAVAEAAVGDRFIVWAQFVNNQFDLAAYDMQKNISFTVANNPQLNEIAPSTSGPWIVYETETTSGTPTSTTIQAINIDTGEQRTVVNNGVLNERPNISGNLLAYESNILGIYQIFVYRMDHGDTFQVTVGTHDEHLNDISGNLVTYIDNGNDDVFASALNFISTQPITASPNPVNFGKVNVGASSTQSVALSINTPLTLSSVAASGDFFVSSSSCALNTAFPANTICTLQVQFTPTKPGQRWFPLVVTDSNSNNYDFGLQGTGVGSALAFTPGIISTVAGNGTVCPDSANTCGDGGPATSADLYGPAGVAVDSAGNLYIADVFSQRIREVNTNGAMSTVAGNGTVCPDSTNTCGDGGPATSAQLNFPSSVAVDSAGNLYIADEGNNRIRKVDANGIITTVAGNGRGGFSGDGGSATSAELFGPQAVAVDSAGNLYIADYGNSCIRKVDASGTITTVAGNGTAGYSGDGGFATSAQINLPLGVAIDSAGSFYIADTYNNRVRKVDASGTITTVAGNGTQGYSGENVAATTAELSYPYRVAVDSAGNLYIADANNGRIRKVDAFGVITTVAGNGTLGYSGDNGEATSAELNGPDGLAVDSVGNFYIADSSNARVRKVDVTTSTLSFGSLSVGWSTMAQTVSASNVGNAALNFIGFAASPNFTTGGISDECSTQTPLFIGANCPLGVTFDPQTVGNPLTGTLTVYDDAFSSPQSVQLSGIGAAAATHFAVSTLASATAGTAFNFTLSVLDQNNNVTTGYPGTVHFTSSDGQAALPADYTFTAADNGTHTFSTTLKTANNQTITVTDTLNPSVAGTLTLTVSPAAASHLAVSAPTSATAGTAFNFTVTALDPFDNTAFYTGTVHFTSSDGQAVLPADYTFSFNLKQILAGSGAQTFSAILKTAGGQTITATDTATPSITGLSNTVMVSAAAASHLVVSAPTSATAGTAFNFTVTALDPFNNTAVGYGGTVHFTTSDGQASLPADYTFNTYLRLPPVDNGTHTFTATLKTAGSQTITATDTSNAALMGVSNAVPVSAASATHLVVSAPASATAGTAFNFTVTALDPFNNTAVGYGGTVHFTTSDGQAILPADYTFNTYLRLPPGDNGTHTFTATLKAAGSQTITASDTANASITGLSNVITVSDFSLNAIPPITLFVGGTGTGQVAVNSLFGFNSPVALTVTGMPAGVTASFSTTPVTPPAGGPASSTLNLSLSPAVTASTLALTVTGSVGTLTHSTSVSVTVNADSSSVTNVINQITAAGGIDNSGISSALTSKLASAQASIIAGDIQSATNTLKALLSQISAQSGKHISTTCCTTGGATFNPAAVLATNVSALLATLKANPDPLVGNAVNSSGQGIPGAIVSIFDSSNNIVASTMTDVTGFYFVATTGVLTVGSPYTAAVTGLPAPYTSATPAQVPFTWQGTVTTVNFVLN